MIKKIFFILTLSFTTFVCFSQKKDYVTLVDLKILSLLNHDEFETKVLNYGFTVGLQDDDPNYDCNYFGYNSETAETNGGYNQISLTLCKVAKPIAGFSTSNKYYFLNLKTAFTKAGFRYTGDKKVSENTSSFKNYSSGSWRISTYTFNKGDVVFYCTQVWKVS